MSEESSTTYEVELDGVTKGWGATPTLRGITLGVAKGELLVVVGPSGCGKSTTLRIVAGLEEADGGTVRIGGKAMNDVAPQDRDVAMVFQGYALYPTMTVRENIEFPLKMRKMPVAERRKRADEAAGILELGRLMDRLPSELSGGERQRVGLARALVTQATLLLVDEPLSALDPTRGLQALVSLTQAARERGATLVCTLHHVEMALKHFPRIVGLRDGALAFDLPAAEVTPERLRALYAQHLHELTGSGPAAPDLPVAVLPPRVMNCR